MVRGHVIARTTVHLPTTPAPETQCITRPVHAPRIRREDAYKKCDSLGTHLPLIYSAEDNQRLLDFRNENVGATPIPLGGREAFGFEGFCETSTFKDGATTMVNGDGNTNVEECLNSCIVCKDMYQCGSWYACPTTPSDECLQARTHCAS